MPKRGNGEGGIYRRKEGRWVGQYLVYTSKGPKYRYIYGKKGDKREDVATKLTRAMADRDGGLVFDAGTVTLSDYLDRWLSDSVRGTVRESTYSRDKYLVTNHIKPALGRLKLKNLNALHLQGLYRERLDSGLSASTVQKVHHVLHKALAQAVRWDLIPRNPPMRSRHQDPCPKRCAHSRRKRRAGCSKRPRATNSKPSTWWPSPPA